MQGKLIKFEPLITNGVHETYQGQRGLLYKFTVTFQTGDKTVVGTANSTKDKPNWEVGVLYNFETSVHGQYTNIKGIKKVDDSYGAKKPDPSFIAQKCFEGAIECTLNFFKLNPDLYENQQVEDMLINESFKFIWGTPETSESRRWINLSALRLTVLKMRANGLFEKGDASLSAWFFAQAKAIADSMEQTVNNLVK